ncbi:MAG: FkbM family methyltransferase [Goleter apudmare HA4340-LM2]|jgi:FkbM family methyltransferase|nr:FkbM family methyltransferase [Goleter apudmare HA4340-LM2]
MHPFITKLLVPISGNAIVQAAIQRLVFSQFLHYLIGIGSGSNSFVSGESVLFKLLKKHSTPEQPLCIFDVGANQGQFLSMAQQHLEDLALEVYSFEPSQYTYKILCDSAKYYDNVTLNNSALGKQIGETKLHYERDGSWLASLSKRRLDHVGIDFKYSETIKIDTLDNYCSCYEIQHIDLLKLDVEGHELDVLEGAVEMLEKKKIKMISFEFGSCNLDSRILFQDIFYFLQAHGMGNIFRITPSCYLSPILEYQEVYEQFRTTNFIALPSRDNEFS